MAAAGDTHPLEDSASPHPSSPSDSHDSDDSSFWSEDSDTQSDRSTITSAPPDPNAQTATADPTTTASSSGTPASAAPASPASASPPHNNLTFSNGIDGLLGQGTIPAEVRNEFFNPLLIHPLDCTPKGRSGKSTRGEIVIDGGRGFAESPETYSDCARHCHHPCTPECLYPPAIMRSCRQFRRETAPSFYGSNVFDIDCNPEYWQTVDWTVLDWVLGLTDELARMIRRIRIQGKTFEVFWRHGRTSQRVRMLVRRRNQDYNGRLTANDEEISSVLNEIFAALNLGHLRENDKSSRTVMPLTDLSVNLMHEVLVKLICGPNYRKKWMVTGAQEPVSSEPAKRKCLRCRERCLTDCSFYTAKRRNGRDEHRCNHCIAAGETCEDGEAMNPDKGKQDDHGAIPGKPTRREGEDDDDHEDDVDGTYGGGGNVAGNELLGGGRMLAAF